MLTPRAADKLVYLLRGIAWELIEFLLAGEVIPAEKRYSSKLGLVVPERFLRTSRVWVSSPLDLAGDFFLCFLLGLF